MPLAFERSEMDFEPSCTNANASHQKITLSIARVQAAVDELRRGRFVVVADDTGRENEGDLILLADRITQQTMAFLIRHTSGLMCVAMTPERLDALDLPLMVRENTESHNTAFTVSVDYKFGTSTGISAADRAATARALANPSVTGADFARPGHVFPLRAKPNGVLTRRGHTEAAVDLARLAGAEPAGVLCELVHDDGTMMRGPALRRFAREHGFAFLTIDDLVAYRRVTRQSALGAERTAAPEAHEQHTVQDSVQA